jgi:hypothetical protein
MNERALPTGRLLEEEGAEAFAAWLKRPDRIPY